MLKIGSLPLLSPFLQAPMAGFSNDAWRRILLKFGGVGLLASEMMHARGSLEMERRRKTLHGRLFGLPLRESENGNANEKDGLRRFAQNERFSRNETSGSSGASEMSEMSETSGKETAQNPFQEAGIPLSVQIWDDQPESMAEFTEKLIREYDIQVIDLNFGCPAADVVQKAHCGSWLLQFPEKIGELAESVVQASARVSKELGLAVPIPVTAKMRLGYSAERLTYREVARTLESVGVSAVTVHGRTTRQMYSGTADWEKIAEVKDAVSIPVIGNGDIRTAPQALVALKTYGVDGVMIGRAALNEPWIFRQAFALLSGSSESEALQRPGPEFQRELLLEHFSVLLEQHEEKEAVMLMRKFAPCYGVGMKNARQFRVRVVQTRTAEEFRAAVREFFPSDPISGDGT